MESQRKEVKSPHYPHQRSARSGGGGASGTGASAYHYDSKLGPYVNLEKKGAGGVGGGGMVETREREKERDLELGPMSSVMTFIGGGGKSYDAEGIYLEQEVSQGWSSTEVLPQAASR